MRCGETVEKAGAFSAHEQEHDEKGSTNKNRQNFGYMKKKLWKMKGSSLERPGWSLAGMSMTVPAGQYSLMPCAPRGMKRIE